MQNKIGGKYASNDFFFRRQTERLSWDLASDDADNRPKRAMRRLMQIMIAGGWVAAILGQTSGPVSQWRGPD
jgi:hypothetical protein